MSHRNITRPSKTWKRFFGKRLVHSAELEHLREGETTLEELGLTKDQVPPEYLPAEQAGEGDQQ